MLLRLFKGFVVVALVSTATQGVSVAQQISLDRIANDNEVGAQVTAILLQEEVQPDVTFIRADVHGNLILREGTGVSINVPLLHAVPEGGPNETKLGNIELMLQHQQRWHPLELTYRAGIAAPTSSDFEFFAYDWYDLGQGRITDLATLNPDYLTLRLSVSPRLTKGIGFLRADVGMDTALPVKDRDVNEAEVMMRLNVAGGVEVEGLMLSAELANVGWLTEAVTITEGFFHTAALSASYNFGSLVAIAGIATPLDSGYRGKTWTPTVAIRGHLW